MEAHPTDTRPAVLHQQVDELLRTETSHKPQPSCPEEPARQPCAGVQGKLGQAAAMWLAAANPTHGSYSILARPGEDVGFTSSSGSRSMVSEQQGSGPMYKGGHGCPSCSPKNLPERAPDALGPSRKHPPPPRRSRFQARRRTMAASAGRVPRTGPKPAWCKGSLRPTGGLCVWYGHAQGR